MISIDSRQSLLAFLQRHTKQGNTIGFVPTMGALHAGHLSLVEASLSKDDVTIVSIFVNPAQFGPDEDLDRYPRQHGADLELLSKVGVSAVFLPTVDDIYPLGLDRATHVSVPNISTLYCGQTRPQFFDGVCQVLLRFLLLIRPDRLYLGEKDFQQWFIVNQMVRDFGLDLEVVCCPLIRDDNGVAHSSRLQYLSESDYSVATTIYPALCDIQARVMSGETSPESLKQAFLMTLSEGIDLDYVAFISTESLFETASVSVGDRVLFAGLVRTCGVRLIDTLLI